MKINTYLILFSLLLILVATEGGCNYRSGKAIMQKSGPERYVNVFADSILAKNLDKISESVRKVNCYADYRTYVFEENM